MSWRRRIMELVASRAMLAATLFSSLLVIVIAAALYVRSRPLFESRSMLSVIFGKTWEPSTGQFGMWPFIVGTLWVTIVAIIIAVPVCMLAAVYLSEYASERTRAIVKPLIDLLAGVPSVVYGLWALLAIVPFIANTLGPYAQRHWKSIGVLSADYTTGFNVLAGGMVLAIMVSPVIISVAEGVLKVVPADLRSSAYALGATRLETITRVVLRKAYPGLVAAVVLGVSRALGETMAVLMVVGNVAASPKSIFDPAYPLPALIANNYGEMMSIPLYDSALLYSALILLIMVLFFNILAQVVLVQSARRLS